MVRRSIRAVLTLMLAGTIAGLAWRYWPEGDLSRFAPAKGKYDVRILRDIWGVPHVFGKTDADAAYGLAWVQCEDDWKDMEDGILAARGRLASARGKDWAKIDYLCQLFRIQSFVDAKYDKELSPDTRAVIEAFADGITHFAATHRNKMPDMALPVTGKDIVAGGALKAPFFYDLQSTLLKMTSDEHGAMVGKKGVETSWIPRRNPFAPEGVIGSNAWAVAPSRSADGATRLAINSHMPWEGPVTFYEAHVHSEQGWNMTGGTFPGGPMIFLGHDENKGWCHTINRPDLADVYALELNPDNPNQYKLDGVWRDFERDTARITVRLFGPIQWTFKRELLWSEHGPVLRTPNGAQAIRFAGFGEVGQLEQWYRMNKARNFDEFRAAMQLSKLSSLNTLYADKSGTLFYAYNAQFPMRADGFDWRGTLPGNTSKALWGGRFPFDSVPQVLNPPSGFIQSCNSTPFRTTDGPGNPTPDQFPATAGIETAMTNRALRALETYGADPSITRDEFFAYKYDKAYSNDSLMAQFLAELFALPPSEDPAMKDAIALLKGWNRRMDKDSRAAGLAILAGEEYIDFWHRPEVLQKPGDTLRRAIDTMMKQHGRLDVPWAEMLRLKHGSADLGLGGGPDCMRAVDIVMKDDGRFVGVDGDCYFVLVEWDKDGKVHSESIHQYGSATLDTKSPHYADQAPLFAEEQRKPVWLDEAEIRAHLEREYRPGEIQDPWYATQ